MKVPWNIESVRLCVTKHFSLKYLCAWGWDFHDLRDAIRNAYAIEKESNNKFDVYINKGGYKKVVTIYFDTEEKLLCVTGS